MNAKPPTRLVVSGGKHVEPHLVMVHARPAPDRRRQGLTLIAKAALLAVGIWAFIVLVTFAFGGG